MNSSDILGAICAVCLTVFLLIGVQKCNDNNRNQKEHECFDKNKTDACFYDVRNNKNNGGVK